MVEIFANVLLGYLTDPLMLFLLVAGTLLGIVLGAIPGISTTMALAILLPVTFSMEPAAAILFLMTVFMASDYGGSVSAILMKIPGTPASIVTQLDGYPMAQQGRAGQALNYSLMSSAMGALLGLVLLVVLAPMIANLATNFRSVEFAAIALFGIVMLSFATSGSVLLATVIGFIGIVLGMVGFDPLTDTQRMTLNNPALQSGLNLIPVMIGLFGMAEILNNILEGPNAAKAVGHIGRVSVPFRDMMGRWKSLLRGSLIGTFVGAIPAMGSAVAVSIAYAQERKLSKEPEAFGKGHPDGIVAPEAANSSAIGGSLLPLMTLGIPGDSITAVLMGALMIHGLNPGPLLFTQNPIFVSWMYASVLLAILATFIIGTGFIRGAVLITRVQPQLMAVIISVFCTVGAFSIRNDINDIYVMMAFGVVGLVFLRLNLPVTSLAFGLILGPVLEENLRRSLMLSGGSWSIFLERPISALLIGVSFLLIAVPVVSALVGRRARGVASVNAS